MQAEGDAEEWAGVTQVAESGDSGLTVRLGHSEQVPVSTRSLQIGLLLLVQETFDAGLQAFQQEGIANITALKDQLLAAKHIQSKAIEARHAALMKRWSQLLANSATRKKKLLEAQSHFRKVWGWAAQSPAGPVPREGKPIFHSPRSALSLAQRRSVRGHGVGLYRGQWDMRLPFRRTQGRLGLHIPRGKGSKGRNVGGFWKWNWRKELSQPHAVLTLIPQERTPLSCPDTLPAPRWHRQPWPLS